MAENLVINGTTYPAVNALALQNDAGETVAYIKGLPVPAYVKTEADRVVANVMARESANPFRFLAFADTHQKNDHEDISNGNRDAGYGIQEVLRLMGVDLVAFLGDAAWGSSAEDTEASVIEQVKVFNRYVGDALKGECQIRLAGNHETAFLHDNAIQTLLWGYNRGVVTDPAHVAEGYGYRDFPEHKVRVVCLNTCQVNDSSMTSHQLKWFAETALDMTDKTDWQLMILSHHPLDYPSVTLYRDGLAILDGFISGGTVSLESYGINENYAQRNCPFIGNFHGHAHSFSVVRLSRFVSEGVYEDVKGWAISIPNACFTRNNQYAADAYANEARFRRYTTETTYNKTAGTAQSTSFNVATVALDKKKIYLDVYGAGVDREVDYSFKAGPVNQIPISTDTDGSIYGGDYNGDGENDGYKTDAYLSGATVGTRAGVETTGFIPFDGSGNYVIYLSGITAKTTDGNFRLNLYNSSKELIVHLTSTVMASNDYAPIAMTSGGDGNVTMLDCNAFVSAWQAEYGVSEPNTPAFFRLCAPEINGSSIITVNEPIE